MEEKGIIIRPVISALVLMTVFWNWDLYCRTDMKLLYTIFITKFLNYYKTKTIFSLEK